MMIYDDDVDEDGCGGTIFKIIESNMEWKKKDKTAKEPVLLRLG